MSSSTRPRRVYKIMSETKRKVAAGRSHGSCGSAPRNYGSCHGCSFVDGVFAPRGGCPNHEPRKLHPLPIPYPYYFASTHPLSRSPENHPFLLFVFHPLPSPPTHPLSLSSYTITDALHPRYRRGSIDASRRSSRDDLSKIGKLTIVDRHPFFLLPLLLIFFLLHGNKRKTRVCLFLRAIRSSAFRSP